jgi:hypothetical protein
MDNYGCDIFLCMRENPSLWINHNEGEMDLNWIFLLKSRIVSEFGRIDFHFDRNININGRIDLLFYRNISINED